MSESVSFFSAFLAGVISFISPCVLPLVPVYLTTMTGLTIDELAEAKKGHLLHIFWSSLSFCLGLSVVFITLGLTATTLGGFLLDHLRIFEIVAGIVIIVFGIHMTGLIKIKYLYRAFQMSGKAKDPQEKKKRTGLRYFLEPFSLGLAFAFGWTPCVGPILAAVLAMAATKESVVEGGFLLSIYSMGLSIPFILSGLAFGKFTEKYKNFRKHLHTVEVVSGVLLVVFGVLIATHNFSTLAGWISEFIPTPNI